MLSEGCTSLTSVTIGNGVTSIGEDAFWKCTSLTSVTIGNNVTSIGRYAFEDCTSLTSVTIPDKVTSIGDEAFYNCGALTSITIPDSVTGIGIEAFKNCGGLTSVTIGNGVTSIGNSAFENCLKLTSATFFGDSPTTLGTDMFKNVASGFKIYSLEGTNYATSSLGASYTIEEKVFFFSRGIFDDIESKGQSIMFSRYTDQSRTVTLGTAASWLNTSLLQLQGQTRLPTPTRWRRIRPPRRAPARSHSPSTPFWRGSKRYAGGGEGEPEGGHWRNNHRRNNHWRNNHWRNNHRLEEQLAEEQLAEPLAEQLDPKPPQGLVLMPPRI